MFVYVSSTGVCICMCVYMCVCTYVLVIVLQSVQHPRTGDKLTMQTETQSHKCHLCMVSNSTHYIITISCVQQAPVDIDVEGPLCYGKSSWFQF